MDKSKSKALSIIFAGLFLCLALIACEKPIPEDADLTLQRGNGSEPETLDPHKVRSESAGNIVRDLYEGLITITANGSLQAGVAEVWNLDPETNCYTFILRTNAKWSNGDGVSSKDFKRGLDYAMLLTTDSPSSQLLQPIKSVTADTDHDLEICLKYPVAYFPEILSMPVSFPRHEHESKRKHYYNGAYYLENWIPQDRVILKKNPNFHSNESVFFEQVNYITTENASSELKRYLATELDITATIPPADVERLRKNYLPAIKISPVLNTYFYGFNQSKAPFKDNLKLRKALSLAIDRNVLVDSILGTGERVAWTLVPAGIKNYPLVLPEHVHLSPEERVKEAQMLYQEAGYSHSNPLHFELRYNTSPLHRKTAIAIAAMWKETLGAEVSLYNEEWKVFVQNRRNKNTQMFRSGWIADVNDASNYLDLLVTGHPLNDYAYNNERYNHLLETAKTASQERISLLQSAEKLMLEDHAIIPLYFYVSKHMINPEIKGWEDNILDHHLSRYLYK